MSNADYGHLAVIIPTFREPIDSVVSLVEEVLKALPGARIIVADDTPEPECEQFAHGVMYQFDGQPGHERVSVISRQTTGDKDGGLGGAVRHAMSVAQNQGATGAIVMDGDGQHPPGVLPAMAEALNTADLVLGTRYRHGGSAGNGLSPARRVVSVSASAFARLLFPRAVGRCSDPMSGLFGVRFEAIGPFWTEGFKVLAHIMVQYPVLAKSRAEVPYTFLSRTDGDSKADTKQGLQYLADMMRLRYWLVPGMTGMSTPQNSDQWQLVSIPV